MAYIYKITNLVNNKLYIGKAVNVQERFNRHIKEALSSKGQDCYILHKAIYKYGADQFTVEIIDSAESLKEINEKERYWIKFYNTLDKDKGYNRALGGDGGDIYHLLTEEEQLKIIKKGIETKRKNGTTNAGRKHWNNGKIQIYSVDKPEGNEWVEGDLPHINHSKALKGRVSPTKGKHTQTEESKKKIGEASKLRCIDNHPSRGKKAYNNGVKFIYLSEDDIIPEGFVPGKGKLVTHKYKKVKCITTNTIYENAKIASEATGYDINLI